MSFFDENITTQLYSATSKIHLLSREILIAFILSQLCKKMSIPWTVVLTCCSLSETVKNDCQRLKVPVATCINYGKNSRFTTISTLKVLASCLHYQTVLHCLKTTVPGKDFSQQWTCCNICKDDFFCFVLGLFVFSTVVNLL